MRSLLFLLAFTFISFSASAQVPQPKNPQTANTVTWQRTTETGFKMYSVDGIDITYRIKDLTQLSTDTLAVLDKEKRVVYLLPDFDNTDIGFKKSVYILKSNVGKDFYITNPYSYKTYVNDASYSPKVTNVAGSYVAYISELDKTYLEKDIRAFPGWGVKDLIDLGSAPDNTFWYRDREKKEYGVIKQGKSIDYSKVTSRFEGDDLIITENSVDKYLLEDYKLAGSFNYKPVKLMGSSANSSSANVETGCVRGDCQNGFGKYQYENGYYDGFWAAGQKNGYGLYSWNDGGQYIGTWSSGQMTGYGVYTAANKDLQKGFFSDGKLNGRAVKQTGGDWEQGVYSNGNLDVAYTFYGNDKTEGCTIGDCQNKYGKFVFSNGDTFVGFFRNGVMDLGTYSFSSGAKYSGTFNSSGQFDGMGRFWFDNGDYYGGEWYKGKYHGRGYFSEKETGTTKIGRFDNGVFKEAQ